MHKIGVSTITDNVTLEDQLHIYFAYLYQLILINIHINYLLNVFLVVSVRTVNQLKCRTLHSQNKNKKQKRKQEKQSEITHNQRQNHNIITKHGQYYRNK